MFDQIDRDKLQIFFFRFLGILLWALTFGFMIAIEAGLARIYSIGMAEMPFLDIIAIPVDALLIYFFQISVRMAEERVRLLKGEPV